MELIGRSDLLLERMLRTRPIKNERPIQALARIRLVRRLPTAYVPGNVGQVPQLGNPVGADGTRHRKSLAFERLRNKNRAGRDVAVTILHRRSESAFHSVAILPKQFSKPVSCEFRRGVTASAKIERLFYQSRHSIAVVEHSKPFADILTGWRKSVAKWLPLSAVFKEIGQLGLSPNGRQSTIARDDVGEELNRCIRYFHKTTPAVEWTHPQTYANSHATEDPK